MEGILIGLFIVETHISGPNDFLKSCLTRISCTAKEMTPHLV